MYKCSFWNELAYDVDLVMTSDKTLCHKLNMEMYLKIDNFLLNLTEAPELSENIKYLD